MARDVFISYASRDKMTADAVCHALEAAGLRCWIAPRDASPGRRYQGSIVRAIRDCSVMVLVFSSGSNASAHVVREVGIAADTGKAVVPFRIEDVEMADDLYYYISAVHWLDALSPPLDRHIEQLVGAVRALVPNRPGAASLSAPKAGPLEGVDSLSETTTPNDSPKVGEEAIPAEVAESPPPPSSLAFQDGARDVQSTTRVGEPDSVGEVPDQRGPVIKTPDADGPRAAEVLGSDRPNYTVTHETDDGRVQKVKHPMMGRWALAVATAVAVIALLAWALLGGDAYALVEQGEEAYEAGQFEEALPLFQQAADKGNGVAALYLSRIYERSGVHQDTAGARRWLRTAEPLIRAAAESGDARAQFHLGWMYEYEWTQEDYENDQRDAEAVMWYRRAAEQGYARAQAALGEAYDSWYRNEAEAEVWLRRAAEQGDPHGMFALAHLYRYDDEEEALRWYHRAAEANYPRALLELGHLYFRGRGDVDRDPAKAVEWYRKAAEAGSGTSISAMERLGMIYFEGDGVEQNFDEAARWLLRSREEAEVVILTRTHANIDFFLAQMYERGEGLERDLTKAISHYREAARLDHAAARAALERLGQPVPLGQPTL